MIQSDFFKKFHKIQIEWIGVRDLNSYKNFKKYNLYHKFFFVVC